MFTSFEVAPSVAVKGSKSVHNLVKERAILTSNSLASGSAEEVQVKVFSGINNDFPERTWAL